MDEATGLRILTEVLEIKKMLAGGAGTVGGPPQRQNTSAPAVKVASAYELDDTYGDPVVKKDPPRWKGPSFAGLKLSECSADFLDCFADFKEWAASNPRAGDDPKWAKYAASDAAKARGWAARIRAGGVTRSVVADGGARETVRTSSASRGGGASGGYRHNPPADAGEREAGDDGFGEDLPFASSDPRHDPMNRTARIY